MTLLRFYSWENKDGRRTWGVGIRRVFCIQFTRWVLCGFWFDTQWGFGRYASKNDA